MKLLSVFCGFCFVLIPHAFSEGLPERCQDFGTGVSVLPVPNAESLVGDFNGDGRKDVVLFLHLIDRPIFSKDVKTLSKVINNEELVYPKEGSLGIGIVFSGRENDICEKYVIYSDSVFVWSEQSMWGPSGIDSKYSVDLVKKGSRKFRYWRKQVKDLKYDALTLPTESSVETLLYWNGESFSLQQDIYDEP